MARILVIDNYDSFVYNLVQYLEQLGAHCLVHRNDELSLEQIEALGVDGILLSPGPGTPAEAGITESLIRWSEGRVPVLGVCLGHQAIAEVYGGVVDRADELLHGRTSAVTHDGSGVFAGLPDPFTATRYHSLAVVEGTQPDVLTVTARTTTDTGGVIMGLRHKEFAIEGVQFHPESVLTQGGHRLLANWLRVCGDDAAGALVAPLAAEVERLRTAAVG
ncbi:aminodeoxychorismate/anthranilate synthase component II [Nakamurella lactea]|uniref:aminodeoxychorismate/anthranilate synthase component II n=1 Tax=Nakamurella lactea TaxID=459515 RepID=UPI0003FDD305|nr:aminodeoxychorismate/anthranilate synthase component II [Nakamurella lactea]